MEPMTYAQTEIAARALCVLRGVNPEMIVTRPHPQHSTLAQSLPAWQAAMDEVRRADLMNLALEEGRKHGAKD